MEITISGGEKEIDDFAVTINLLKTVGLKVTLWVAGDKDHDEYATLKSSKEQ